MPSSNSSSEPITRQLVDVVRCPYYLRRRDVPPVGTEITVRLEDNRVCVDAADGDHLGFINECGFIVVAIRERGVRYSGKVVTSRRNLEYPVVVVQIFGREQT